MVFRELANIRSIPMTFAKAVFWVRTAIRDHAAVISKRLGSRIPPQLIKSEDIVTINPSGITINESSSCFFQLSTLGLMF